LAIAYRNSFVSGIPTPGPPPWTAINVDVSGGGLVTGDVLLACLRLFDPTGVSVSPPSGWTLIDSVEGQWIFKYVYAGETDFTWSWTPGVTSLSIVLSGYSGVDQTNPINTYSESIDTSSLIMADQITPSVTGCWLVGFFGTSGNTTITPDAAMTERQDHHGFGSLTTIEAADENYGLTTPTGSRTATAGTSGTAIAHLIALTPADVYDPAQLRWLPSRADRVIRIDRRHEPAYSDPTPTGAIAYPFAPERLVVETPPLPRFPVARSVSRAAYIDPTPTGAIDYLDEPERLVLDTHMPRFPAARSFNRAAYIDPTPEAALNLPSPFDASLLRPGDPVVPSSAWRRRAQVYAPQSDPVPSEEEKPAILLPSHVHEFVLPARALLHRRVPLHDACPRVPAPFFDPALEMIALQTQQADRFRRQPRVDSVVDLGAVIPPRLDLTAFWLPDTVFPSRPLRSVARPVIIEVLLQWDTRFEPLLPDAPYLPRARARYPQPAQFMPPPPLVGGEANDLGWRCVIETPSGAWRARQRAPLGAFADHYPMPEVMADAAQALFPRATESVIPRRLYRLVPGLGESGAWLDPGQQVLMPWLVPLEQPRNLPRRRLDRPEHDLPALFILDNPDVQKWQVAWQTPSWRAWRVPRPEYHEERPELALVDEASLLAWLVPGQTPGTHSFRPVRPGQQGEFATPWFGADGPEVMLASWGVPAMLPASLWHLTPGMESAPLEPNPDVFPLLILVPTGIVPRRLYERTAWTMPNARAAGVIAVLGPYWTAGGDIETAGAVAGAVVGE